MKIHFTIEFPTKSGDPADYEDDIDVMNPQIKMQPGHSLSKDTKIEMGEVDDIDFDEHRRESERMISNLQEKFQTGDYDKEEMEVTLKKYQEKNMELIGKLQNSNLENAKLKAIMKQNPDEHINQLLEENEDLKNQLKNKLKEKSNENQEDTQYLKEEIHELREKLKETEENLQKKATIEREISDEIIKARTELEKMSLELREQKSKMEEKYKHFEELNKYISDLLHEKKKMGLLVEDKSKELNKAIEELEELKHNKTDEVKKLENEIREDNLNENKERWEEFQKKIDERDTVISELKSKLENLESKLDNVDSTDEDQIKGLGEMVLQRIDESEDICEVLNIDFERSDMSHIRHELENGSGDILIRLITEHDKLLATRHELIYNNLRG